MNAASNLPAVVIVAYRPKPGKDDELLQLTREHVPLLRAEGLATDRPVIACLAKDGSVVEVFEWLPGGAERAHSNPVVLALWKRYAEACEIIPSPRWRKPPACSRRSPLSSCSTL